jgi:hypothetical protein
MKIPVNKLHSTETTFHGIMPGMSAVPLGRVTLDIVFDSKGNYRKEKMTFEVVNFDIPYHAIFGRPAYAKFMARPCYIYSKLKMPGPKGVITIDCNQKKVVSANSGAPQSHSSKSTGRSQRRFARRRT